MKDIEEALALLAAPCTDERFFQRALKALSLVTQCRWTAICCPDKNTNLQKMIAFCDNKQMLPCITYPLNGAPCENFYTQNFKRHILFSKNLAIEFPYFELLKHIKADSYQGEAIVNESGKVLGHIFVMDPFPQFETIKSKEFIRILSQRIGAEYCNLRLLHSENLDKNPLIISINSFKEYIKSQLNKTKLFACIVLNIQHFDIISNNLGNENTAKLLNIIEERLLNNISKKDRIFSSKNNEFIVVMQLNKVTKSLDYQTQLSGLRNRLVKILNHRIEINNQKLNLSISINSEMILDKNNIQNFKLSHSF